MQSSIKIKNKKEVPTDSTRKTHRKVIGYRIQANKQQQQQKRVTALYTNEKHTEKYIRKIIPFLIV